MKTVKIHCIRAKATRLNQPEMIDEYREAAVEWDEARGVCVLEDDDHKDLNLLWDERAQDGAPSAPKPCEGCRGLHGGTKADNAGSGGRRGGKAAQMPDLRKK